MRTVEAVVEEVRSFPVPDRLRLVAQIVHEIAEASASATPPMPPKVSSIAHVEASHSEEREHLIQHQEQEASRFPGEFVIMVGRRVLFHSVDRDEAISRYESAFDDVPEGTPVLLEPGQQLPRRDPVVRARSSRELSV